jgi:hypothetical protein
LDTIVVKMAMSEEDMVSGRKSVVGDQETVRLDDHTPEPASNLTA